MDYISKSIKLLNNEKRFGYYAIKDIPAMSIILIETAKVDLFNNHRFHEMFQILYKIFNNKSQKIKQKFMNLLPLSLDNRRTSLVDYNILYNDLNKLTDPIMKNYFLSIDPEELQLYCMKYLSNAFGKKDPIILFNGAMFNHSCSPNVKFIQDKNIMYFITVIDIKSGEELFDNYVNLTLSKTVRQNRLFNQYGFRCNCRRCLNVNDSPKYTKNLYDIDNITINNCKIF